MDEIGKLAVSMDWMHGFFQACVSLKNAVEKNEGVTLTPKEAKALIEGLQILQKGPGQ